MKYSTNCHPTEDVLVECAISLDNRDVAEHLTECPECMEYVDEMRTIQQDIIEGTDEEVPEYLHQRILSITRRSKQENWLSTFIQTWHKRPFLYGIVSVWVAILLYVIFEFML